MRHLKWWYLDTKLQCGDKTLEGLSSTRRYHGNVFGGWELSVYFEHCIAVLNVAPSQQNVQYSLQQSSTPGNYDKYSATTSNSFYNIELVCIIEEPVYCIDAYRRKDGITLAKDMHALHASYAVVPEQHNLVDYLEKNLDTMQHMNLIVSLPRTYAQKYS